MRILLSWLNEYISLPYSPSEIAKMLTMIGLEVDHYETIGDQLQDIVVGSVLETVRHPQADQLILATVSDGVEIYQIVCGASNCRAGIKTALARIGAKVGSGEQALKIKKAKIRGIESFGMLCSASELGLSEDGEGILELPNDLQLGTSLAEIYADTFFDISLTPNLSHCTSVMGVARELAALTEQVFNVSTSSVHEIQEPIENSLYVEVGDKELCPYYTCRIIKNIQIGPSPAWLKERLEKSGLRSVNNVVDVTNYILLERGHPLHAFDYDKIEGQAIIVRKAKQQESLVTLDNKERLIKENMLCIADMKKPLAIAGVMGGAESEIHEQTRKIVLESAYFNPISIRRTSKQLGLQTDASKRFERGTDPSSLLATLERATELIQQVAGGEVLAGIIKVQAKEFPETIVHCRLSRINKVLGIAFSRGEVENIFKRLQFSYQWDGNDQFNVRIPTYRVDIQAEVDLIEEVARFYGYDHIPRQGGYYRASTLPSIPIYLFEKKSRSWFISEGLQEFLTCDLIGPSLLQVVQNSPSISESMIKVLNPTSIEQSILRTSLLPGLLQVVKYNIDHQNDDLAGFEIGRIHFRTGDQYQEQTVIGIILTGKKAPPHWDNKTLDYDFYDLKGIVENFLQELRISTALFKNLDLATFHSGRQCSVFIDSLEIGSMGEIHPAIQRRLDVSQRILFAEFNLQNLLSIAKSLDKVQPVAIYPSSDRDWTLTIKKSVAYSEILSFIHQRRASLLEEVSLKDIYLSEKIGIDYHNLTLHFVYRDPSKTIEQESVDKEHHHLIADVLQQFGQAIKS